MLFDVVFFAASVWRIHQNNIKLVFICIIEYILRQRIVVHHTWRVYVMQKHVGDTKHVWELLLFNAIDGPCIFLFVFCCLDFLIKGFQPTGNEATCTTSEVCHFFADLRIDDFCHEISQGSRSIKLTSRTSRLHLL